MTRPALPAPARLSPTFLVARVMHTAFFLLTSAYCLLTYNAFAYRQFIKPHLVLWLTDFVVWHHAVYWLVLLTTAWTLRADLVAARPRWFARGYLGASAAVGLWLLVEPVLPQVENNWRGLMWSLLWLVPVAGLALCDFASTRHRVRLAPSSPGSVFAASVLAGGAVWTTATLPAPWRLDRAGDIPLSAAGVVFGMATSALAHAAAFTVIGVLLAAAIRVAGRWTDQGQAEFRALAITSAVATSVVCARLVFASLTFVGPTAWVVAAALGLVITLAWSGVARRIVAAGAQPTTAVQAWLAPFPGTAYRRSSCIGLVVVALAALAAVRAVEPADWDFLFQRICVVLSWGAAMAYAHGALRAQLRSTGWRLTVPSLMAALLIGGSSLAMPRFAARVGGADAVPEFVLEGYGAVDPSFRLIHDMARVESADDLAFYRYLRSHSTVQEAAVEPVSVDFSPSLAAGGGDRPHLFVFVIDSLRRDYVSAYNRDVSFTPAIGRFASESVVFERAFTRYGGTGLSVPSLWSGGMLFHKQYVTPFAPMNALMKLLEAERYQRVMSLDSVVAQLFPPGAADVELDRQTAIVDYDLCRTLKELDATLGSGLTRKGPVFAYTLPQNLHISHVRSKPVPPGVSYPGFVAPVAAETARMDACFGAFIESLKTRGLYDDSVIVLTADHGDSLGESRRWGHSYTMFPEVVRVPLIVHLPGRVRDRFAVNPEAVALLTDLTPTFYALLGHPPADLGSLYGRPLLHDRHAPAPARSREPLLLASSYGPVYAVLRDEGRSLYIADGVNNTDYAFDLSSDSPIRVGVTDSARRDNQAFVRAQVDALADAYGFHPAQ